jgi:crotonobetainyl-CoA:carnitine CoA-transferase CaiB-like acyl-CoA transferase
MTTKLLEGIRVVEASIFGFVPSAAAVLSDWGADVIKVEHPETGDPVRNLSSYGFKPGDAGVPSLLFEVFNRGKRSMGLDIRNSQGRAIMMSLIDGADVFLTNFLPATCTRLGLDADQVMARNPKIIYGRGTGHGPIGPDANVGGFDALTYWGRSGAAIAAMAPGDEFPVLMPGPAFGDIQSGMHLAGGIVAGLYRRERTGKGAVVDVSLLSAGLWAMQASIAGAFVLNSDNIQQLDRRNPPNPIANVYRTKDGRSFTLGMLEADRYWEGLCAAVGRPELTKDPRFLDSAQRAKNTEACVAEFDKVFEKMTLVQVTEALNKQEGPWAYVRPPGDALTDEQARVNGFTQMVEFGDGVRLPLVTPPVQINREVPKLSPAPKHAEHTDAVLAELGHTEEQIIDLKVAGVVS